MKKIYLLDNKDCQPCAELKEALKQEIDSGKVQVLDLNSEEATQLMQKAGSPDTVNLPSALVEDESGVKYCEIYHSKDITLSKCGDEIVAIREPAE